MRRNVGIAVLLVVLNIFPAASIYAWQMSQRKPEVSVEFKVLVNGTREVYVLVPVDLSGSLTKETCEVVAEAVFMEIMGGSTLHRFDRVSIDGGSMDVHIIWGYNEGDMGHFFDVVGDIGLRMLIVTHCR